MIVMAVHTWGFSWQRQKILFNCDNLTVVDIWAKGSTNSPEVMALVQLLYFCAACYNINVSVQHISGTENKIADAISRFQDIRSGNWLQMQRQHQLTSLHSQHKPSRSPHAAPVSWCRQVNPSSIPVWIKWLYILLLPL